MKRFIIYYLRFAIVIICALCSRIQGANEINAFSPGVTAAYTVVREADGDVWYVTGQVFEAWGTGARTAADYDIALTDKSGGMFVGTMDTNIGAGQYYIVTHIRVGASPADTDPAVWQEYGDWTGTVWTAGPDASDIDAIIAKLPTNYIMGSSDVDDHDTVIDSILEDTSAYDTDGEHAGAIWNALMASYAVEASFGGEVQQLDPNITLILADTSAFDTPGEYASAIWDAALSSYTGEANFGGELQQLDPNLTLVLADTDDLQTWWADGGRLDLLVDAIKAVTDILQAVNETVVSATDANTFVITHVGDVNDVNDAYTGMTVYVQDATTGDWESRLIIDWETGYEVTVDEPFTFTPEAGDVVVIWGQGYFPMDIWDSLPLPLPQPSSTLIDNRVTRPSGGVGGTVTLNYMGDDP